MERLLQRLRVAVDIGLIVLLLGMAALLLTGWIDYLRHPGTSPIDAYRRGTEPWTSISVAIALAGSLVTLLTGALVALLDGSWIRKLIVLVALGASAYWWLAASGVIPVPGYKPIVPVKLAYSLPETAALLVLLPAALAAAMALWPRRVIPSSRMAPIHPEERQ